MSGAEVGAAAAVGTTNAGTEEASSSKEETTRHCSHISFGEGRKKTTAIQHSDARPFFDKKDDPSEQWPPGNR